MGLPKVNMIVTGASGGIGMETANYFYKNGYRVHCIDMNVPPNIESNDDILWYEADVTNYDRCKDVIDEIVTTFGNIRVLFNNAGIIIRKTVTELTIEEWKRVIDVNLTGVFNMCKAVIPSMLDNGGVIINTSSGWGVNAGKKASSYCASKGGLILLTKSIALDYGEYGIRCNAICPGDVDTMMLKNESEQLGIDYKSMIEDGKLRPIGRIGTPKDIAECVYFLASDGASYITGTSLIIDGGSLAGSP